MTGHEIHALSGAYAVNALGDFERRRFEAHWEVCAACQHEVAELQAAAAALAGAVAAEPPPAVRAAVLAEISRVRPLPPRILSIEPALRRPRRFARGLAAVASVALVLGGVTVWQHSHQAPASASTDPTRDVLRAADVQHVSAEVSGDAVVTVYRSPSLGEAVVRTRNLPPAPVGKVYQLWIQDGDGHLHSAGLLHGAGNQRVLLEGDARGATAAGISIEPAGGSSSVTLPAMVMLRFRDA